MAQESQVDSILNYMKHAMLFNRLYPQEKVYLHFDNTGYFKGETIWFKAYVVRTDRMERTDISHVLYVELLNPSGDVVEARKLKIEDGMAHGDIRLDSILGSGFYEVRAYTRYMLNWGENTVFSRVFPVFEKPKSEGDYSKPTIEQHSYRRRLPPRPLEKDTLATVSNADNKERKAKGFSVHCYPEGGHLVQGLSSRVAFEVMDREGKHVSAKGILIDSMGEIIGQVEAGDDGRGRFDITPSGRLVRMVLTDGEGKKHEFDLDDIRPSGCTLRFDAVNGDNPTAYIHSSPDRVGEILGYCIMNRGCVVAADTLQVAEEMEIEFDRHSLQPGVNQFTLFSADGHIQAERLFFICPTGKGEDSIRITSIAPQRLQPCAPVELQLDALPNASLSFSAMDAATMTNGKEGNMWTWMLLSSDLKGYIPHPEYFFEADDSDHRRAVDSLMLFNGWRRYDWSVMADVRPWQGTIQQVEDGLYLFGKLKRAASKWKTSNRVGGVSLSVYMYNQRGEHYHGVTVTDSAGNYAFKLPDIEGEWNTQILTQRGERLKSYTVTINRQFRPKPKTIEQAETVQLPVNRPNLFVLQSAERDEGNEGVIKVGKHEFVTPTVRVKGDKRYFTDDSVVTWYDENYGRNHASLYYDCDAELDAIADRGEKVPDVFEFLAKKNPLFEYVKGEELFLAKTESEDSCHNILSGTYNGNLIIWVLNNRVYKHNQGINTESMGQEDGIQPFPTFLDEVKSIYISNDPAAATSILGGRRESSETVIFVYTHPTYSTESRKGRRNTYFQGFNRPSTFQMEDYSQLPPMEDFRRTLYWNPDVRTDGDGKATVRFFNNSSCESMYISAEGMTHDGRIIVAPWR